MNRYINALLLCCFVGHSYAAKGPEPITILADDDYPPYSYVENGVTKGIYVNLVRRASTMLLPDYKVKVIAVPWKRALKLIETGQEFAVLPPYIHIESRPYISHYSEILAEEQVVIYCRKQLDLAKAIANDSTIHAPVTLGMNSGYLILNDKYKDAVAAGKIELFENKSTEANIQKLVMGRIDCYVNDKATIVMGLTSILSLIDEKLEDSFELKDQLSSNSAHIGYSSAHMKKHPSKLTFIKRMDEAIKALNKTQNKMN